MLTEKSRGPLRAVEKSNASINDFVHKSTVSTSNVLSRDAYFKAMLLNQTHDNK